MSLQPYYFVGRKELLFWINDFFHLNYTKIEEVCSGALFCHIMDALHPGFVPMHKVNFLAKYDYEYIKNYKILQEVFTKVGVSKVIEVNKLIKGKYQDNLEFLQWIKGYFDENWQGGEYDAVSRRKQNGISLQTHHAPGASRNSTNAARKPPVSSIRHASIPSRAGNANRRMSNSSSATPGAGGSTVQTQEINKLKKQNAHLSITVDNLEKERDFYFCKLRDIEILCQGHPDVQTLRDVEKILYATDEEEALEAVNAAESQGASGMDERMEEEE